jgi:hypothetical protein
LLLHLFQPPSQLPQLRPQVGILLPQLGLLLPRLRQKSNVLVL